MKIKMLNIFIVLFTLYFGWSLYTEEYNNKNIFLASIFVIYVFIVLYIYNKYKLCTPVKYQRKKNLAIILTTYIGNDENKKSNYTDCILKWLNNTPFDIYVVESSGQGFDIKHPRLKYCVFDQSNINSSNNALITKIPFLFQTYYEIHSLNKILEKYEFSNYDFVFKVTGKYYFNNLDTQFSKDCDMIVQHKHNPLTFWQNCEIVGMKPHIFIEFVNYCLNNQYLAFEYALYFFTSNYNYYRMSPLKPYKPTRNMAGFLMDNL